MAGDGALTIVDEIAFMCRLLPSETGRKDELLKTMVDGLREIKTICDSSGGLSPTNKLQAVKVKSDELLMFIQEGQK